MKEEAERERGWKTLTGSFENAKWSHKPRNTSGLKKLGQGNQFSPRTSEGIQLC